MPPVTNNLVHSKKRRTTVDIKRLMIATVVAGVALLVVDFILDMVPFIGNHHPHGHHEHPPTHEHNDLTVWGILGALFHGLILAVVLGWRGVGDPLDGAKAGATYGVLLSVAHGVEFGHVDLDLLGGIINSAIVVGIAGAAVAMFGGGSGD